MTKKRATVAASIALLALLFTGCSAAGSDTSSDTSTTASSDSSAATSDDAAATSDQSTTDACTIALQAFQEVSSEVSGANTTDLAASATVYESAAKTLREAADKITNSEVSQAFTPFADVYEAVAAAAKSGDTSALQEAASGMADAPTKLQEACS